MIRALALLGADSADQLVWIDKYKVVTDELALEFDDVFLLLAGSQQEEPLDEEAMRKLRLIDAVLEEMSGGENAERWSREALATDEGWHQVRALARDVLVSLQGDWRLPLPEIHVVR
ncbi:hypothetical protein GA0115256_14417 [Streptomyces sp. DconLS]|uniref:hypothetical protein n=1 Tax=Streptomyces TaxID=1883 RepID=UPI00081DFC79|nr:MULTISPECIES: hypothetical protein [unclassified Streptomyces]SCF62147.1 hypothetical protein GA0115258_104717 [Streptomyces sp. LamerLS-31b]SCG01749.1 hypothetical protein GA0115256_14417 [Streptomyces sp. DconLS]